MHTFLLSLFALLSVPFLFPEEFISWSRQLRRRLRDRLWQRLSAQEWEAIADEFSDL